MATVLPVMMLPYRDVDNRSLRYATAGNPAVQIPAAYDSDAEPLLNSSAAAEEQDPDALLRFTATGQPMPVFKYSAMQSLAGDMFSLPHLLPVRYTDDSIVPAIVVGVIPSYTIKAEKGGRRASFISRIKTGMAADKKTDGRLTKVVYMPRRDYLKWFARGFKGEYLGTEEAREWTEDQLDEAFGQWQPKDVKKGRRTSQV